MMGLLNALKLSFKEVISTTALKKTTVSVQTQGQRQTSGYSIKGGGGMQHIRDTYSSNL